MTITATRRTMATMIFALDPFQWHRRDANEGVRTSLAHTARRIKEYDETR